MPKPRPMLYPQADTTSVPSTAAHEANHGAPVVVGAPLAPLVQEPTENLLANVCRTMEGFRAPVGEIGPFRGAAEFLSNRFERPLSFGGMVFRCAEGAFQAAKFDDPAMKERFRDLSVGEARRLGRTRHPSFRKDWEAVKEPVMAEILKAKFTDPELKAKLLATGDAKLVEYNTWGDEIWGVSLKTMKGDNRLGKLLMERRESLKNG